MVAIRFFSIVFTYVALIHPVHAQGEPFVRVQDERFQTRAEVLSFREGASTIHAVILRDTVIAGQNLGSIFLVPLEGTEAEATEVAAKINTASQRNLLNDIPVVSVQISYAQSIEEPLSTITDNPSHAGEIVKVGHIRISARALNPARGASFGYGLSR